MRFPGSISFNLQFENSNYDINNAAALARKPLITFRFCEFTFNIQRFELRNRNRSTDLFTFFQEDIDEERIGGIIDRLVLFYLQMGAGDFQEGFQNPARTAEG